MKVHLIKFTTQAKHKLDYVKLSNINNRFLVVDKGDLANWIKDSEILISAQIKDANKEVASLKTTSKIEHTFLIGNIFQTK